ncbi:MULTISPECIES: thioesterase II family protein [Thermomonosporaceae]|uniref:thioesterase II family protein n=1 Tax=Thermomonosporaceae TaxID=2012 RepID=UPI00255A992B|nr:MULTISPECIES: thioesterase domain-containing protein [Thermomonosporaceae]MDL4775355.1 thioesterase domain-containing protein [Actinomadura xylanilytica]
MTLDAKAWLVRLPGPDEPIRNGPAVRLFGFPNVGAGPTAFAGLARRLPARVEMWGVALPGREARFTEPPRTELAPLVAELAAALLPHTDHPYALFGYCSGALLAYLVARRLADLGAPDPVRLVVADYPPPHLRNRTPDALLPLESGAFWDRLIENGGIPEQIVQLKDLREVFEPAFRADYRLLAQYEHRPGPPVRSPITSLTGGRDPRAGHDAAGWGRHSDGGVDQERIGHHKWILTESVDELADRLGWILGRSTPMEGR